MPKPISPIRRIDALYSQCLTLMEKEVAHMATLAIVEKLPSGAAKDLIGYVKLLGDMKQAHKAILDEKRKAAEEHAKKLPDSALTNAFAPSN